MVDYSQTPNQDTATDDQNFDVDINKLATDWINPIDAIRSYAGINSQSAATIKQLSQSGNLNVTDIAKVVKIEQTVQESRAHAFYRWIGFPVADKDHKIYNPGFDIVVNADGSDRQVTLADKIAIFINPPDGFQDLSLARENFAKDNLVIFSVPESVDAGVLALSSGGNNVLRKFSVPFLNSDDGFDFSLTNQSFQVDFNGLVGEETVNLSKYQDDAGNTPKKVSNKRTHIIKPFMVDARIDFSISPQPRLIAVPFVPDKSATKVDAVNYVKRPLIEKIIRDRFAVDDPTLDIGTANNTLLKIISDFPDIKDNSLIQLANNPNNLLNRSEQLKLTQAINTIKSMMQKLVDAQNVITQAQSHHYWLPAPSTSGPEGGCSIQGIFLPTIIDSSLITDRDGALFFSQTKDTLSSITSDGNSASGNPSAADFGLSADTVTFTPDTTNAFGDNNAQNLQSLINFRQRALTDASDALKIIELIMGEFSGFGLCDIVAIISALNVIPKESLVGFLDADAKTRMSNSLAISVTSNTYDQAMTDLCGRVKDFYNLMDKIYTDILRNNSVS